MELPEVLSGIWPIQSNDLMLAVWARRRWAGLEDGAFTEATRAVCIDQRTSARGTGDKGTGDRRVFGRRIFDGGVFDVGVFGRRIFGGGVFDGGTFNGSVFS